MRIFNSTSGTTDIVESTMSAAEIAMFNNKFLQYEGKYRSVSEVKSLANLIMAHNATVPDNKKVDFKLWESTTKLQCATTDVEIITDRIYRLTGSIYAIKVWEYGSDGLIKAMYCYLRE